MKIVLCNGVFEVLHYGHLLHLQAASKLGDRLVVSVTKDEFVNKGEGRPVFNQNQRAAMLKALRFVDQVILVSDALDALMQIKPDIFVKGQDYRSLEKMKTADVEYCRKHQIRLHFTHTKKYSSTALLSYYARP